MDNFKVDVVDLFQKNYLWADIFNYRDYIKLNQGSEQNYCFQLFKKNELRSVIWFSEIKKGFVKSPKVGTYGGFSFIDESVSLKEMEYFLFEIEEHLKSKNITNLEIKLSPSAHNYVINAKVVNLLRNFNFQLVQHELDYYLEISNEPLYNRMKRNNRKRFNKCKREGFSFHVEEQLNAQKEAYNILSLNRKSKGYELSMSFAQLIEMKKQFSSSLFFFTVKKDDQIVASSICIQLNSDVLYVFYWGEHPDFKDYSPVTYLAGNIYDFAESKGFTILDAGTSTIDGQPQHGLIRFKAGLGFKPCLKETYSKAF